MMSAERRKSLGSYEVLAFKKKKGTRSRGRRYFSVYKSNKMESLAWCVWVKMSRQLDGGWGGSREGGKRGQALVQYEQMWYFSLAANGVTNWGPQCEKCDASRVGRKIKCTLYSAAFFFSSFFSFSLREAADICFHGCRLGRATCKVHCKYTRQETITHRENYFLYTKWIWGNQLVVQNTQKGDFL